MAIFKVLCLIGFVLLSSGYAREHGVRHGSFPRPHHHGFHRYKHILKRHVSADGISREGADSKRSERVEESSNEVWQQKGTQGQIKVKGQYKVAGKLEETDNNKFPNEMPPLSSGKKPALPGGNGQQANGEAEPPNVILLPGGINTGTEYEIIGPNGKPIPVKPVKPDGGVNTGNGGGNGITDPVNPVPIKPDKPVEPVNPVEPNGGGNTGTGGSTETGGGTSSGGGTTGNIIYSCLIIIFIHM